MKNFKKIFKLLGFVLLVILASVGLGINAAILPSFRKQDSGEAKIESMEKRDEESDVVEADKKQ